MPGVGKAMSDFTDDEDRQLVQLALVYLRKGRQTMWDQLTRQMRGTKKSKEALRQRLKTLKRTHGRNLEKFPPWFFKKEFANATSSQHLQGYHRKTAVKTTIHESDKLVRFMEKTGYKPRRMNVKTKTTLQSNGAPANTSAMLERPQPRARTIPKCLTSKLSEPPSSLLLLASVASTSSFGTKFVDSSCSRV